MADRRIIEAGQDVADKLAALKAVKAKKTVVIRLTPEQADLVYRNADGWIDAGSCKDGLTDDENAALQALCDQISKQIHRRR